MDIDRWFLIAVPLLALVTPSIVEAQAVGRIADVGGVLVASEESKALARWYRDVLGVKMEPWGAPCCAVMQPDIREGAIIRLIGAVLLEVNDEWQTQNRYMRTDPMAELMAPIINIEPARIDTVAA